MSEIKLEQMTVLHQENVTVLQNGAHHCVKRAPKKGPESRLDGKISCHMLLKLSGSEKKNSLIEHCRVCTQKKIRSWTTFFCAGCEVPLHPGDYFS
jgi:hypothetical protein